MKDLISLIWEAIVNSIEDHKDEYYFEPFVLFVVGLIVLGLYELTGWKTFLLAVYSIFASIMVIRIVRKTS